MLHVPIGMFFLAQPPEEPPLPLPDFRRMADAEASRPSTELVETIHTCQLRQDWYRDYTQSTGGEPLEFVGSATLASDVPVVAAKIRATLGLEVGERSVAGNWTDFLRLFIRSAQNAGILVMVNGIVGNNTRRKLSPREFRGFAIADKLAPLIFINGSDTKAGQIFTLAHEIAHIWLGESGVSKVKVDTLDHDSQIEAWCNKVAAETLVPQAQLLAMNLQGDIHQMKADVARTFRVSTLVALRRLHEVGRLNLKAFRAAYDQELADLLERENSKGSGGGNFYDTMNVRVDRRFATAVISSALEGRTLIGDAMNLLNVGNTKTLRREARELGFAF
jgi:Zn-dependent peptidase ImmA (M78 family)